MGISSVLLVLTTILAIIVQLQAAPKPDCTTTNENGATHQRCDDGHGGISESTSYSGGFSYGQGSSSSSQSSSGSGGSQGSQGSQFNFGAGFPFDFAKLFGRK